MKNKMLFKFDSTHWARALVEQIEKNGLSSDLADEIEHSILRSGITLEGAISCMANERVVWEWVDGEVFFCPR